jgi:hypothetical protein
VGGRRPGWHAVGVDRAATYKITRVTGSAELATITERLLALLPSWFGIPEANAEYVESAMHLPAPSASSPSRRQPSSGPEPPA